MQKDGYGSFGTHALEYSAVRRKFPKQVMLCLKDIAGPRAEVLDLGCGTGISSRQIADHGFDVVGIDIDERMVRQAEMDSKGYRIEYLVSSVGSLSFCSDREFNIVTAFSAFHWFCGEEPLAEIKRVLAPDGLLFVVNKNDVGEMNHLIKSTLRKFIEGEEPLSPKLDYDPIEIMSKSGFKGINGRTIQTTEEYTLDEVLAYVQTMSIWNLVLKNKRTEALEALKHKFAARNYGATIPRPLAVRVVYGFC